jgi:hypothetical protein
MARIIIAGGAMSSVMTVSRLYTDERGDSRFDTYDVALALQDHAPPASPFFTAEAEAATKYMFFRIPPGWVGAQHTTPNNRLVVCLAGALCFIGSTGETLTLHPGDRMMDMNTTGRGHSTAVASAEHVEGLIIRVD